MDSQPVVYKVYILQQVVKNIVHLCKKAVPRETLGRLLGYRLNWEGIDYIKIVDLAAGSLESSYTHARFTIQGTRECELFLDERYGENRPLEVGLYHSHPFNSDPHFSSIDHQTFLNFPYDKKGNTFILIDPLSSFFKVYVIEQENSSKKYLKQIPWMVYSPKIS